ncbi:glutathione transport system permease protein GsiD [mine drainage metagenome]|uniref:Glutathione transport system permease protein GsiD n=1 Tax=mine drainage metagenome TaxID=410659 RepID=A0A1J5RNI6_9ZZZZ
MRRPLPAAARVGLCLLLALLLAAAAAPWLESALRVSAEQIDLSAMLLPPSAAHLLGTDDLGRDLLARLLRGGRVSLLVALSAASLAALLGTLIGLVAGTHGGWADALLMRLTDGVIALPLLPLLIVLGALDPAKLGLPPALLGGAGAAAGRIIVIIALVGWTTVARLVRAAALSLKQQDFIRSAQALGLGPGRIMLRHILPNTLPTLVVAATLSVGNIMLLESALSFLGLGIQPPLASWGTMLNGALQLLFTAPVLAVWPGAMIFLTVMAFNLLGDGLQQRLDPRQRG